MSAPWSFSDSPKAKIAPSRSSSAARAFTPSSSPIQIGPRPSIETCQAYQQPRL